MAGRGPAPKAHHARASRDTRETVKSDGRLGGHPLPRNVLPKGQAWHPMTVKWWNHWRRSPQGVRMMTEPDWDFLLDTALIHHEMWANGRWEFAAEVRLRVAKVGVTPEDRARLKIDIEIPETAPVGNSGNDTNVTRLDERRNRWGA